MPAPLALQLFTVRDALKHDFAATIRRIAELGYVGVEPFGLSAKAAKDAKILFDDLELEIPSAHMSMPLGEHQQEVLQTAEALECRRIVSGYGPREFQTLESIRNCCDRFNEAQSFAAQHNLEFGIHNHWWEYVLVEDQYPYQLMLELLDPAIFFEVDTYWVKVAGPDPAEVLAEVGERSPLLHIKDGPAVRDAPMTAVGQGTLDIPKLIKAGEATTEWLIVELDDCATDMMAAVGESYHYLVSEGLARGNR